ncbi:MAG: extracellular solute-binding protein [Alphaproteobacteria bacterium]
MHVRSLLLGTALIAGSTAVAAQDLAPISDETIYFRGWQYRTDIVQENIDRYNSEMGGHIDYATVTGDYPSLMEQNFIAGRELDILYANPSQAVRYFEAGWIKPAEDLPNAADIRADMYPNILDAWSHQGKLLGLSYFVSVRGMVHVNLEAYEAAGYTAADYPADWDALYDMVLAMHDARIAQPLLPHWFSEWYGISWAFAFEVMNRGGQVADPETHAPMLTADGPAGDTLRAWKRLWNAGVIPEEVLSYNESAYIEAYGSGRYVFSPQQSYDLRYFNDPANSQIAGHDSFLPYQGQSWGLIDSAMYLMSARERSDDHTHDVMAAANWYGYKDQNGDVYVGNRWMQESMLFSGYRSVMEGELAEKTMLASLVRPEDRDALLEVYAAAPYPKGIWNVVWSEEFNSWMKEELPQFLLNDGDVDELVAAMNEKIEELNEEYGI